MYTIRDLQRLLRDVKRIQEELANQFKELGSSENEEVTIKYNKISFAIDKAYRDIESNM